MILDQFIRQSRLRQERDDSRRPRCENCAWFGRDTGDEGRCIRFPPPPAANVTKPLRETIPQVKADWLCGEFMNAKTLETFYSSNQEQVQMLMRRRISELEEQIDQMMAERE